MSDSGTKKSEVRKDRSAYQKAYYESKRQELSAKRKSRYRSDPEARRKAIENARAYRIKKKAERDRLIKEGKIEPKYATGPRLPVDVEVDGRLVPAYTITTVSKRVKRSVAALNAWSNSKMMPLTPFRSPRGDRLYTDGMIMVIKMAVQSRGLVRKSDGLYGEIVEGWKEIGIRVD